MLIKQIQQYHESSIDQERVSVIAKKWRELSTYGLHPSQIFSPLKTHYLDEMKKFMSAESKPNFDVEVAFPCDIDLNWYLVPKSWIREIVQNILTEFTV